MPTLQPTQETIRDARIRNRRTLAVIDSSPVHPHHPDLKRRLVCSVWQLLPPATQRLAVRLAAPKVSLGACGVIQDSYGRVLLAHHTYRRQPWSLPGGFVKTGEQPAQALERELREELGVAATAQQLLYADVDPSTHHMTLYYRVTIAGTPGCDGVELDDLRYVSSRDIPELVGDTPRWASSLDERKVS